MRDEGTMRRVSCHESWEGVQNSRVVWACPMWKGSCQEFAKSFFFFCFCFFRWPFPHKKKAANQNKISHIFNKPSIHVNSSSSLALYPSHHNTNV